MNSKKIIVKDIKVPVQENNPDSTAFETARQELRLDKNVDLYINKKSIDTRHKNNLMYVYSIMADMEKVKEIEEKNDFLNSLKMKASVKLKYRPVIIGFGPCGIFAAYLLALCGYRPIVFERGEDIDKRVIKAERLFSDGILDYESNVCYGEGGAGLFSDGKLMTRIKDDKIAFVFDTLVKFGASKEILYQAKPHVGTDKLKGIVKNIRAEIINNGGEIYFNSKLTDIMCIEDNSDCIKIKVNSNNSNDEYKTNALFLATGHSAEDIYNILKRRNVSMLPKPYSMGFRIEHKQEYIDEIVYGKENLKYNLPKSEYSLSYRDEKNNRGVYTFCMCPGGVVVNSSTENDGLVTNGMSYYKRDKENANSAVLVSFSPSDYGSTIESSLEFRRMAEKKAYILGGGNFSAPAQTLGSYLGGKNNISLNKSNVKSSYTGKIKETNLNKLYPKFIDDMLHIGFEKFNSTLKGFLYNSSILTAPETRTSAPIRIVRNNNTSTSVSCEFIYPVGEGAGYAGGITSSAVDGINAVFKFIDRL